MPVSCLRLVEKRCGARRRIAFLLLTGLVLGLVPTPAIMAQAVEAGPAAQAGPYDAHIADAAQRFGIPASWVAAVLRAESAGDPRAVSSAGAMGLMQVMPDTFAELRARYGLGRDPFAPHDNIMAGTAYLREMLDRYGNLSSMLAAYNAGPGRYEEYLSAGRPLPAETRAYVAALAPILGAEPLPAAAGSPHPVLADWRAAPLFVARFSGAAGFASDASPDAPDAPGSPTETAPHRGLFVPRSGEGDRP